MCSSYRLLLLSEDSDEYWKVLGVRIEKKFQFDIIFPGKMGTIITEEKGERVIRYSHFGLIPSWAKDKMIYKNLFNARSETIEEKPSFKNSFKKKRCLIPATQFYETKKLNKKKYTIRMKTDSLFCFAGIYDEWKNEKETIISYSIITTEPNRLIQDIHNRMPVIVEPDCYDLYLDSSSPVDQLKSVFKPYPAEQMKAIELSESKEPSLFS